MNDGSVAPAQRRVRAGLFLLAALAGGGCRRAPAVVEISAGPGGNQEPSYVRMANEAIEATRAPAGLRIAVTLDTVRGTRLPDRLELADQVAVATRQVARPNVLAVVGPGGSRDALQVAPIYREAGMPQILPSATSELLPGAGPWTFRIAPSDSAQGEFIGEFVSQRLHARAVTLFYIPDEYGRGLSAGVSAALARLGVTLLDRVPATVGLRCGEPGVRNPYDDAVLSSLRHGRPDVMVIAGAGWETTCIALAAGSRLPGVRVVAGDASELSSEQRRIAGIAADSIYLVGFWHATSSDSASRNFDARFRRLAGRAPNHGDAMWYDAAMLVATAIRAGGPERKAIRDYLISLGRTRPPYTGVTGPIAFTPGIQRPLLMTRLTDSGTVVVAP